MFSKKQVEKILDVIEYSHTLLIASTVGEHQLTLSDKNILTRRGVDWRKLRKNNSLEEAFTLGKLAQALRPKETKQMSFKELKGFVQGGKYEPLSNKEQEALNVVRRQLYSDVKTQQSRIVSDIYKITIDEDKKALYTKILKEEAKNAVNNRLTVQQFAAILAERTQDWTRDFNRIADYILHTAYQFGKANQLLAQYGENALVYYAVEEEACEHCKRVYLIKSREPRIFQLASIITNGSNIGVKAANYKPSIYPLHPRCKCELMHLLEGYRWDKKLGKFVPSKSKFNIKTY